MTSKATAMLSTSKKQYLLDGLRFRYVCRIEPVRDHNGTICIYHPQSRYNNRKASNLHAFGSGFFCKFNILPEISESGVFAFTVNQQVKYIGECKNLTKRLNNDFGNISPANCYQDGQQTHCRVNREIYEAANLDCVIEIWFCKTDQQSSEKRRMWKRFALEWML